MNRGFNAQLLSRNWCDHRIHYFKILLQSRNKNIKCINNCMLFSGEHYRKDRGAGDAREWVEVVHRVLRVGPTERAKT